MICMYKTLILSLGSSIMSDDAIGHVITQNLIKKKVKAMILMGEAKERIFSALGDLVPTEMVKSLNEAVIRSFELAQEGDIVLFSPACSSFDMFVDYKERGRRFIEEVKALEQKVA